MTAVCLFRRRGRARPAPRMQSGVIQRRIGRWVCPAIGSASALWLLLACDSSPVEPIADVDASVQACEIGEEGCNCRGGGGCRDDLLCIAGRCLATEPPTGGGPVMMSPRPAPQVPTRPGQTPPDPGLIVVIPEPNDAGALDAAPDAPDALGPLPVDASIDGD